MALGVPYAQQLRKLGGEILQTILKFALWCGIMVGKGVGCLQNILLCVGIAKERRRQALLQIWHHVWQFLQEIPQQPTIFASETNT